MGKSRGAGRLGGTGLDRGHIDMLDALARLELRIDLGGSGGYTIESVLICYWRRRARGTTLGRFVD
jgi:hypothetical protein